MHSATAEQLPPGPAADNPHPIRAWRERQQPPVSPEALADRVGTTRTTIWRIENGQQWPAKDLLRKLLAVCEGVTADAIVGWESSPTRSRS